MELLAADNVANLTHLRVAWDDLAQHALEANVFYESWMLLPALEHLREGSGPVKLALVRSDGPGPSAQLLGVFPLEFRSSYHGLPLKHLTLWQHKHCFLGTPLIRKGYEQECLGNFFEGIDKIEKGAWLLELRQITADGPFHQALHLFAQQHGRRLEVAATHERACLESKLDAEGYLQRFSGKHRKELRRKSKRLAELGQVTCSALTSPAELAGWVEDFLALEAGGWKGRSSTALAAQTNESNFFRKVAEDAFQHQQLDMLKLCLDGKPAAMRCDFVSGEGAFFFKIAYDEKLANCSPGVLLELEDYQHWLGHPTVRWVDSCADPSNRFINELWLEKRTISTINVSTARALSPLMLRLISGLKHMRRKLRERSQTGG